MLCNHFNVGFPDCSIMTVVSPFLLNSIDLDHLKEFVVASAALIEAKLNHHIDIENCKL